MPINQNSRAHPDISSMGSAGEHGDGLRPARADVKNSSGSID